jgi:integrase
MQQASGQAEYQISKALIATAGNLAPRKLTAAHVAEVNDQLKSSRYALSTKVTKASALRRILRHLWEHHGSQKLDQQVSTYPGLRPRNVTVTDHEKQLILEAADPHLRLWLLLCSDLALRSTTAANVGPQHYNHDHQLIRISTKMGAKVTLPVTAEIAELIGHCQQGSPYSFVRQLWVQDWHNRQRSHRGRPVNPNKGNATALRLAFRTLLTHLNISRRITPHDFRRTTAVAMLGETGDVRDVQALLGHRSLQATIWYLDHDLRPISRKTLELIKGNRTSQPKGEQTA